MTGIYLMILLTSLAIVTTSIYYYAIMTGALFLAFFMMQVSVQVVFVMQNRATPSGGSVQQHMYPCYFPCCICWSKLEVILKSAFSAGCLSCSTCICQVLQC
jgi:hypothetical protein